MMKRVKLLAAMFAVFAVVAACSSSSSTTLSYSSLTALAAKIAVNGNPPNTQCFDLIGQPGLSDFAGNDPATWAGWKVYNPVQSALCMLQYPDGSSSWVLWLIIFKDNADRDAFLVNSDYDPSHPIYYFGEGNGWVVGSMDKATAAKATTAAGGRGWNFAS
jgi:hypothetical protein